MRFTVLDSWRGLCALWVAIFHFRVISHIHDLEFIRHGSLAVDFFFVLSGFVITNAYGDGMSNKAERAQFLLRRFGRLYPLHLVTFLAVLGLEGARWFASRSLGRTVGGPLFTGETDPGAIAPNLLLAHGWGFQPEFTWNVPSWSISVEFLVCFLFLLATFSARRLPAFVAMLMVGFALFLLTRYGLPHTESSTAVARGIFGFFLGAVIRYAHQRLATPPGWLEWLIIPVGFLAVVLEGTPVPTLMFGGMVLLFAYESGPISRLLKRKALTYLGEISYSIYLVHYVFVLGLFGVASMLGRIGRDHDAQYIDLGNSFIGDAGIIAYALLIVGVASLTYRWIETPGRDGFNRLSNRLKTAMLRPRATPAARVENPEG